MPLSAVITTVLQAIQVSLASGVNDNTLFVFARALKAFESTTGTKLPSHETRNAFALWWSTASPKLPKDADFDEWRFVFEAALLQAKVPLGANPLQEAIRRAGQMPGPPQADRYSSPKIRRLASVCNQLQQLAGDDAFFLSVRSAAKVTGTPIRQAAALLNGLVRDGVLVEVVKGIPGGKRATRFKFNLSLPVAANYSTQNGKS